MGAEGNVRAAIGYTERTGKRPYFYANAHEKDYVPLKPREVGDFCSSSCIMMAVEALKRKRSSIPL